MEQRVVIIDVSGLFYKYAFGSGVRLSTTITLPNGVTQMVDTTLQALTIKQIHRWSNFGYNPTVVCFDDRGSTRCRKAYFAKGHTENGSSAAVEYKDGRGMQDNKFFDGVNMTFELLRDAGVNVMKAENYEADDLIMAAVTRAKEQYPNLPIDVITGDQDLVPLVDDQVSVFLASRKMTWAESKDLEKRGYVQLTPRNFQGYIEGLTAYNKLIVPYNALLLVKLLRGDSSDKIPAYPKFTPTKFNILVGQMIEAGYDMGSLFRYDKPVEQKLYRGTNEPVPESELATVDPERIYTVYKDPAKLTEMLNALSNYLDEDQLNHVRWVYNGINLNGAFQDLPDQFKRKPARIKGNITGYLAGNLQKSVSALNIQLPMG